MIPELIINQQGFQMKPRRHITALPGVHAGAVEVGAREPQKSGSSIGVSQKYGVLQWLIVIYSDLMVVNSC